jgi:hypothetical protein
VRRVANEDISLKNAGSSILRRRYGVTSVANGVTQLIDAGRSILSFSRKARESSLNGTRELLVN